MILTIFSTPISAEDPITIYVNETHMLCDVAPYIENGRTMVPMRKIFEALDAVVDWDETTQTITATKGHIVIVLQINNGILKNNGIEEALDAAPVIVDGSTFVPVRAVSQSLKANVQWLEHNRSVYINSPELFRRATEKNVTMYAPGGRTIVISQDEVEVYQNVGWYRTSHEAQAANKSSNSPHLNQSNNSGGRTVYRTPTGKKYHFDPECGGKNSYETTIDAVSHLMPCSRCAW